MSQLKCLKPKSPKKGHTNFYQCCNLTKKVYLVLGSCYSTTTTSIASKKSPSKNGFDRKKPPIYYTTTTVTCPPSSYFVSFVCTISFLILNNILEDPIDEGEPKSPSAREKFIKSANSGNPTYSKGFLFDFLYLFINSFLFCDFS